MADSSAKIDRTQTTPFLLKVFYRINNFHRLEDFRATSQPTSLVEVYTWKDCTLAELSTLLLSALPSLASTANKCSFRLIYADRQVGRFMSQELGSVPLPIPSKGMTSSSSSSSSDNGSKTLEEARFITGDWIDVSIGTSSPGAGPGGSGGGVGAAIRATGGSSRENGLRVRGLGGGRAGGVGGAPVPSGEWRRGERVDDDSGRNGSGGGGGGSGGGGGRHGGRRAGRW